MLFSSHGVLMAEEKRNSRALKKDKSEAAATCPVKNSSCCMKAAAASPQWSPTGDWRASAAAPMTQRSIGSVMHRNIFGQYTRWQETKQPQRCIPNAQSDSHCVIRSIRAMLECCGRF